ncbi:hypothetical protein [Pseudomonas canadensis]|uniref:hypothetical protein n=1 Tax=Pseudomonas canadensis TaxID=915099 RepID=UPI0030DDCFC3
MAWFDLHDAPRDRPVWLFLPSAKFTADAQGRPIAVEHEVVVASWNGEHCAWVTDERYVFPSLWSDADPQGASPELPVLA